MAVRATHAALGADGASSSAPNAEPGASGDPTLGAVDNAATGETSGTATDGTGRRPTSHRIVVWALRALILAVGLALWQWYGDKTGGVFVPTLTDTLRSFPDLISFDGLGSAFLSSNVALLVGYPLSAVVGLALGFVMGRNRTVDRGVSYWLDVAMVIPMVTIVPIVIIALGLGLSARIFVVMLFAVPVIALNARASVLVIDGQLVEMAGSFEASRWQIWKSVILPAAIPVAFSGLSIGIGRAISGMVIIELVLVPAGLGGLLLDFKSSFSGPQLYAVTLVVALEGIILTSLARALEHKVEATMRGGRS